MKELSLHILDIVQNSISAKASQIEIIIHEDTNKNILSIEIKDNGIGMDNETLQKVTDPFWTSRTTRKVGLGIPLFKAAAERCDGHFYINSEKGKGTIIKAEFKRNHIDRAPLGDIADTISLLILTNEGIDFKYTHQFNGRSYNLNTVEIKQIIGDMPIHHFDIIEWIKKDVHQGIEEIKLQ